MGCQEGIFLVPVLLRKLKVIESGTPLPHVLSSHLAGIFQSPSWPLPTAQTPGTSSCHPMEPFGGGQVPARGLGTQELKGWLYLSASQLAGTRTCLGGHREVWTGPSHSCCRTDFIWNMSLMVQPLVQFSSVSQSLPTICDPMVQHTRPCCPSPTPRVYSNSCPLSW